MIRLLVGGFGRLATLKGTTMSEKEYGRLPEHPDFRRQVRRGFRLDDVDGRHIHISALPNAIVAYFDPKDIRVHIPDDEDILNSEGEAYVWEDIADDIVNIRPRLFQEADGTRVLALRLADRSSYEEMSYECNMDSPDPARSGWRPVRYSNPVDEWAPQVGRLESVLEEISGLCFKSSNIDALALAAAAQSTFWDTAAEIDGLIDWLRDVQSNVNERFTKESEIKP